jgi:hypothetical protein
MSAARHSARSSKGLGFVLAGPAIWAMHFFVLYASEGFLCAAGPWAAADAVRLISLTTTTIAVAALLAFLGWQAQRGWRRQRAAAIDAVAYRDISMGLAVMALLAVIWSALPAILLPVCTPAA